MATNLATKFSRLVIPMVTGFLYRVRILLPLPKRNPGAARPPGFFLVFAMVSGFLELRYFEVAFKYLKLYIIF